jgi:hypothetical protein
MGHPRIAQSVVSRGRCAVGRWDPDLPYSIVANGCHMWPVRGRTYVVLVKFIPL